MLKKRTYNRMRGALLATALVFFGIVVIVFFQSRNTGEDAAREEAPRLTKSGLHIGRIQHTATRNGRTEWQLEAASAEYLTGENLAVVHDPAVTFFLKNGEKAFMKAREGTLDTSAFDIDVRGNVVMENDGYRLEAEQLSYRHGERIIFSELPVTLKGNGFTIASDRIRIDMKKNQTLLEGNVRGTYDANPK